MRLKTFQLIQLKLMPRPSEYMDELRSVALAATGQSMTFNLDDPAYQALKTKYRTAPRPKVERMAGAGDLIARATSAVGIKPCGGCKKRQQKLNKLVPFR